jgi:ubiquinone/menaquinone biosynthesis C-methylase UbiE
LKKFVKTDFRILDLGCGMRQYGASTPAFYIGLDVTDEPFSEGRPRIVDIVASATDIPAPDHCYDLVFSVGALYQMPDPFKALLESYRVLRPSGRILVFDYNRRTQKNWKLARAEKGHVGLNGS